MNEDKEFNELIIETLLAMMSLQLLTLDFLDWTNNNDVLPENIKNKVPDLLASLSETATKLKNYRG